MAAAPFKLSAQLSGHQADVRAVSFPNPKTIFSASRDNTLRKWQRSSSNDYEPTITAKSSEFISCVANIPPCDAYPEGLVASSGKDTIIDVRSPNATPEDNAERLLIGHANTVATLAVSPKGDLLVSGGWDCQARVWNTNTWETQYMLLGHEMSVWSTVFFNDHVIVTACADKQVRIYDLNKAAPGGEVKARSSIHMKDIVRSVCRLPSDHPSGADIASASNDGVIRLWKLNGTLLGELTGHTSFIYQLNVLPSGEIISCGEDRTARVWKGMECFQTITLPAISVWTIAASHETGDFVTGSSDGVVRVFTRETDRVAADDVLTAFDEAVKASSIPQQQVGSINKEKLPGQDFIQTKVGTKDGQVQMVKHDDGSVQAYTWSQASQKWEHVGAVVDSVGSTGNKTEFNGKEYDYVFDVDIEDGKPPLKLPFNLSQNPFDAARDFLERNKLPLTYLDNVVQFIQKNTQGATIGDDVSNRNDSSYGVGASDVADRSASTRILPQKTYLTLFAGKFDNMYNKIITTNKTLVSAGRKGSALNPAQTELLAELRGSVEDIRTIDDGELQLLLKLATEWDYNETLPVLDILRFVVRYPAALKYRYGDGESNTILDQILEVALYNVPSGLTVNVNSVIMAVRALVNLFSTDLGRGIILTRLDVALGFLETIVHQSLGATNRHLHIALATAYLNFSVLATSSYETASSDAVNADSVQQGDIANRILPLIGQALETQNDSEVLYRNLIAVGTLATASKPAASSYEAITAALQQNGKSWKEWVTAAAKKSDEQRLKDVARECSGL